MPKNGKISLNNLYIHKNINNQIETIKNGDDILAIIISNKKYGFKFIKTTITSSKNN